MAMETVETIFHIERREQGFQNNTAISQIVHNGPNMDQTVKNDKQKSTDLNQLPKDQIQNSPETNQTDQNNIQNYTQLNQTAGRKVLNITKMMDLNKSKGFWSLFF